MSEKRDTHAWWTSLTLKEQADYVEKKMREKGKTPDRDLVVEDLVKRGQYRIDKPTISVQNWSDWCSVHSFELANAGDSQLWKSYAKCAEEILRKVHVVSDGSENCHIRVDLEHMYPYIEKGGYDA